MNYLAALLTGLLSLLGYQEPAGTTSITRIIAPGKELLFSKIDIAVDKATLRCLQSGSGQCFYRVFLEHCSPVSPSTPESETQCRQHEMDSFALSVGQRRDVSGLPLDFGHCVAAANAKKCRRG